MVKLIASDLGGTPHRARLPVPSAYLACALESPRAAGIDRLVTGRPSRWLTPLREQTDFDLTPSALTVPWRTTWVRTRWKKSTALDPAVIARTHELLEPMFPDATYTLKPWIPSGLRDRTRAVRCLRAPARGGGCETAEALERIGSTSVIKYLIRVPGMDPDILQARAHQAVGSRWCR